MSFALGRPVLLNLEAFAQVTGQHPEMVCRFVDLGLLEPVQDSAGGLWFDDAQRARLARLLRIRASFSVNYAALGLVVDLLDRVAILEAERPRNPGGSSWT